MWVTPFGYDPAMRELTKQGKTEDGVEFPAAAYAYVPDADSPSTWKLRLWQTPQQKETARQVGMAVAALGPGGFRGNRVQIPRDDLPGVKRRVLQAWLKVNEDKTRADAPRVLLSSRPVVRTPDEADEVAAGGLPPQPGPHPLAPLSDLPERSPLIPGLPEAGSMTPPSSRRRPAAPPQYLQSPELGPVTPEEDAGAGYYWDEENKEGPGGDHHDMDYSHSGPDAMMLLLQTYRAFLSNRFCWPLIPALMEIIHAKQEIMLVEPAPEAQPEAQPEPSPEETIVLPMSVGGDEEYGKVIRYEDGQYCVYSDTGRAFGCYTTEAAANERLSQLESYSEKRLAPASDDLLIRWHQGFHQMVTVTEQDSLAHDLVEDELVRRGFDRAIEMVNRDAPRSTIMKREESRYTLGPAYVPDMTDAHGEFTDPDTLQRALWEWVRKDDRRIFLQHSEKQAGEMVEVLTWPFPISAEMVTPNQGVTKFEFPSHTPFLGVIWEDWAWELVKAGELRGYSIGGRARRVEVEFD